MFLNSLFSVRILSILQRVRFIESARCVCVATFLSLFASFSVGQSPLDSEEEAAFVAAGNFGQGSVVQIETFGGQEFVNKQLVAPGPFSGTVLSEEGWIATSTFFFRSQPASITILLPNGERKAAKLVARDYSREIALLKIDSDPSLKSILPSKRSEWRVGQWTIALGKSFDANVASRSVGILSAQGRIWDKAIQTDCKISPQNYGGPLLDISGRTMGVLTPLNPGIVTEGEVEQWYDSGVGFAIPIDTILERLPLLQTGNDIHPGRAGFRVQGKDEFLEGITLVGVSPGSPAAKSGLKAGDSFVRAGRSRDALQPVSTHAQLKHILGPIDAGQNLAVEVERKGKEGATKQIVEMTLVKELPSYREPYFGIVGVLQSSGATKVVAIAPESPASLAGIEAGMTITAIGKDVLSKDQTLETLIPFRDFREPTDLSLETAAGDKKVITIQPATRPDRDVVLPPFEYPVSDLTEEATTGEDEEKKDSIRGTVQIPLSDVKNRAFAIVPNNYRTSVPHGLLLVFADAGPQDPKVWSDLWEKFCAENRWICAVVQSAEEKAWSFEEFEVGSRVRSYLLTHYTIDTKRICGAGIASGGTLALISTGQSREDYNAVWLSDTKIGQRIRLRPAEPKQSLRFFIDGNAEGLEGFSGLCKEAGYSVNYHSQSLSELSKGDVIKVQDAPVYESLQQWLRHLEAF